jgi:hypothetical protein
VNEDKGVWDLSVAVRDYQYSKAGTVVNVLEKGAQVDEGIYLQGGKWP